MDETFGSKARPGQSKPAPDLRRSEPPSQARPGQARPGQSKPPGLKQSKPLQPRLLEQTRTGKLSIMVKTTLRAGVIGAEASILKRFSSVVLESQFEDNGKQFFRFRNSSGNDGASNQLLVTSGLCRWVVKIMKEGNPALYYFEMAEQQATDNIHTISRAKNKMEKLSRKKKMLYKDIMKDGIASMLNGKAPNPSDCYKTA
eukprot:jgi/Psemu1/26074/gm1.26074_g